MNYGCLAFLLAQSRGFEIFATLRDTVYLNLAIFSRCTRSYRDQSRNGIFSERSRIEHAPKRKRNNRAFASYISVSYVLSRISAGCISARRSERNFNLGDSAMFPRESSSCCLRVYNTVSNLHTGGNLFDRRVKHRCKGAPTSNSIRKFILGWLTWTDTWTLWRLRISGLQPHITLRE